VLVAAPTPKQSSTGHFKFAMARAPSPAREGACAPQNAAAHLLKENLRRGLGRPGIYPMIGLDDRLRALRQHLPERPQLERVPPRTKRRQILFRQSKQPDGWSQASPVFWVRWMLELFLQMHESARGLDQALEILRVVGSGRRLEPDLLENIVGLIVSLFVPAAKKSAVIWVVGDRSAAVLGVATFQRLHELGNSLAFAHESPNLGAPAMMGKRARFSLREGERLHDRRRSEK
jgi:hypothetical protein